MSLKPGTLLGHYVIIAEVGRGGMSTVYRARQASLQRDVAVKVLPDFFSSDETLRERFAREAATIARLRHPNIVTVFDFGDEDGTAYIVTEFLDGETLAARLKRPLTFGEVVSILRAVAAALDYAHERGVLHRDVKPSNVILDLDGRPTLTDFGLSRLAGSLPPLTRTGAPIGTPEYMAPELASGGVATASVDQYALAVMAFEMLTGELPYHSEAPLAVLLAHVNEPPPQVSAFRQDVPRGLDGALARGLAKDPADRYASCGAFVDAIDGAFSAAGELPPAEPATTPTSRLIWPRPHDHEPGPDTLIGLPRASTWGRAALEAIQNPLTLIPLSVAFLTGAYRFILAPEAGAGGPALAAALAALVAAGAAFFVVLPKAYHGIAEARADELRERNHEREHQELRGLGESLGLGFAAAESTEGVEVLRRLSDEYQQLGPALAREAGGIGLVNAQVPGLATETYRRGLSVLVDALELTTTARTPGPERLRAEIVSLEREISSLQLEAGHEQRLALRRRALESHRERLAMLEDLQLQIEQLFSQARQCEAALHRTRITMAALHVGGETGSDPESVIRALQRTIEQARAVQDEVRKLGY